MRFRPYKAWLEQTDEDGVEVSDRAGLIEHINSYGLVKATSENTRVYQFGVQPEHKTDVCHFIVTVKLMPVGFTDGPC